MYMDLNSRYISKLLALSVYPFNARWQEISHHRAVFLKFRRIEWNVKISHSSPTKFKHNFLELPFQ